MNTRRTQPYRKGSPTRRKGPVLSAMLRGATAYGRNPMDSRRRFKKQGALAAKRRRRKMASGR